MTDVEQVRMSTPAKTEVRLSRDAEIPRGTKVTLDVTVTYEIPWDEALDNLEARTLTINEFLADLATAYGKHTSLSYVASQEKWDLLSDDESEFTVCPLDEDGHHAERDMQVEQEWESEARKVGRWVPANREYREVLG